MNSRRDRPAVIQVAMAVRDRCDTTRSAIAAAREAAVLARATLRWVVFDDGSSDETPEMLEQVLGPADQVIRGNGTAYWAGGMRRAMSHALEWDKEFDYLLMLNDDSTLYPTGIQSLLKATEVDSMSIAVGTFVGPGTGVRTYGGGRRVSRLRPLTFEPVDQAPLARVDVMNANAVLMTAAAFSSLGPLREPYTHALADFDYALSANKRGIVVLLATDVVGECPLNETTGQWLRRDLSLGKRWAAMRSPKGLPPREWATYCLRHGSLAGPLYALSPLVRLLVATRKPR